MAQLLLDFSALREKRLQAVACLAEAWRTPRSPWMRRAQAEIPRSTPFSAEMVRACLQTVFSGCHADALHEWLCRDLPAAPSRLSSASGRAARNVLIVLPSTVFAAAWQAATAAWLSGASVVLKPSRREPVFAKLLCASARATAGAVLPIRVCHRLDDGPFSGRSSCVAMAAYGKDSTIARLQTPPAARPRFLGFGARISIAFVGKTGFTENARRNTAALASRAAWDATLYETQGCLSPQCFYVEEGGRVSPLRFAESLADAMNRLDARLPQRPVADEAWREESFWQRWRFLESQGRARLLGRHVIFQREPGFEPCGLRRVVFVAPVRCVSDLRRHVRDWRKRLSCVAASDPASLARLKQAMGTDAGIRCCSIGEMHQPPPWWRNGGINLLREFAAAQESA